MALSSVLTFTNTTITTVIVFITFLHLFFCFPTLYCSNHSPPPPPPLPPPSPSPDFATQGLLVVEKTRLGSTPPSCYNKCNKCHPCMAVQVPTLPNHGREQPSEAAAAAATRSSHRAYYKSSLGGGGEGGGGGGESNNRYSNYKPLGWKCRCNGHFYNP